MAENENQTQEQAAASAAPAPARAKGAVNKRKKTWQEKLDEGVALTEIEDVKSEADYAVRRHLREQKERQAFEARKNRPLRRDSNQKGE